jgi:hypothetical protein
MRKIHRSPCVPVICVPKPKTTRHTAPRVVRSQPAPSPSATEAVAALDALADALAPRIFARLKALAQAQRDSDATDADTLDFLEGLGWRRDSPRP